MSLICHRIVSTYTPNDTIVEQTQLDDAWEKEQPFGPDRRLHSKPAPMFIPAAIAYDEFGMPYKGQGVRAVPTPKSQTEDVASWYRGITTRKKLSTTSNSSTVNTNTVAVNCPASMSMARSVTLLPLKSIYKQNRFSSPQSLSEPVAVNSTTSLSTLADLLSRNPPPLHSEPAFNPPVFLTLGSSNKGFTMLQNKGWKEGESLGRIRRVDLKRTKARANFQPEVIDLTHSDVESERDHVIDLTDSADEVEDELDELLLGRVRDIKMDAISPVPTEDLYEPSAHGGTALVTPLPTVLKADRLGIGLKARRTRKAITHSRAEISAFIQTKKKSEKKWGKGSKGMARKSREEELRRAQMLKYLKEE